MRETPRPPQPTPGSGPPDSTQSIPSRPGSTMCSAVSSPARTSKMVSMTVRTCPGSRKGMDESCLGSQPTCNTFFPPKANTAVTLVETVDLPIPPLP